MLLPYLAAALLVLATVYAAIVSFREPRADVRGNWFFPQGAKRPARIAVGITTLTVLIALSVWFGISARHSAQRSLRFLIPDGYTGWVRVEFEVQGAPPLSMHDGSCVLKISSDGTLKTSSPEHYGWANDEYYYSSDSGVRRLPDSGPASLIWGKLNGEASGSSGKRKYEEFFVGSRQQFEQQPSPVSPASSKGGG
jgi:hypothetical protein